MRKRPVAADSAAAHADDLFRSRLVNQIDLRHPLARLAGRMPWADLEEALAPTLPPDPERGGRPALPVRLMAGLRYLKHAYDLSDEAVCERWLENPYWQFFTGEVVFQTTLPCNPSSLTRWRQRLGEAGMEELLARTIAAARAMKAVDARELSRVIVDTTVQEKAIAHPTDSRLLEVARKKLVLLSRRNGLKLRQTYEREAPGLARKAGRHAHARQFKRMRRVLRRQRTLLGRVIRDIGRQLERVDGVAREQMQVWLERAERIRSQQPRDKSKLYALHAPEVECIGKGKARKPYEFGVKVRIAVTARKGLVVGARSFPGNPYDGDTLEEQIEQVGIVSGTKPTTAIVDLGYRGREIEGVTVLHRGKPKTLTRRQWAWVKRRQAVEPVIGHLKDGCRLRRCHLKGAEGDRALEVAVRRVWDENKQVYGAKKVWKQLLREGWQVARCTVERLMRRLGLRGVIRGKPVKSTVSDKARPCPLDRVNRQFHAERPNALWVSDFTYVSTWQGMVYVAFVVDVYARRIVGWKTSSSMTTDFVLDALEQALHARQREGELIHHSDRGSQYVGIRYSERLAEAGIEPSVRQLRQRAGRDDQWPILEPVDNWVQTTTPTHCWSWNDGPQITT